MSGLDTGDCNYNWNNNKDISLMAVLNNYTKEYYTSKQSNNTNEDEFHVLDENVYIPENCKGNTHKFRIFIHLLVHYQWNHIDTMHILPESHHIKIQGKPGAGKTFVIKAIRNITKNILKHNRYVFYNIC